MTEQESWDAYCAKRDAPLPVPPTDAERWAGLWALVDRFLSQAVSDTAGDEWSEGWEEAAKAHAAELEALLPPRTP